MIHFLRPALLLVIFFLAANAYAQLATAPQPVRVNSEGRVGVKLPVETNYRLSEINVGAVNAVFADCEDGDFYLGFQLFYDLGDKNTQTLWQQEVELAVLQNGTEQWRETLHLDMESQTFIATVFHEQTIQCTDNYTFQLISKNGVDSPPHENIYIRQKLYKKDQDIYNPYQSFALNYAQGSHANEFVIDWNHSGVGTVEYELQWVFIDDQDNFSGSTGVQAFAFKEGASIFTAAAYYRLQSYYPDGRLWFRVRSIGINHDYPEYRIPGQWQYGPSSSVSISNHAGEMNWQVVNTFAEEGKSKNVMRYLDGSLRERQLLTNLNTDEYILVAENLYDFEGRPAVNVLPAPVEAIDLQFRAGLNTFMQPAGWDFADKFHYDNQAAFNSVLDSATGASRYYSTNNDLDGMHRELIPGARGYAYAQSQFLNDNTGRLRRQSGVGPAFNIDDGKVTRYFYGSAAKAELVRLFGSNVGNAYHYRKNAVVDPNGQVSISYIDQEGRTIATSLAGESPGNLEELPSLSEGDWTDVTVDISDRKTSLGKTVMHSHKILNTAINTGYNFVYSLSALAQNSSDFGCIECAYDLEFSIAGPDGSLIELPAIAGNESADNRYFRLFDFTAEDCAVSTSTGNIEINDLPFSEIGEYIINKKLTAKDISMVSLETIVLSDPQVQAEIETIRNTYVLDESDCEFCNECDVEELIEETIAEVMVQNCQNIYNQIVQDIKDQHTGEEVYTPTQEEIEEHSLYCKYAFCQKNTASDRLDAQITRVNNWNEAVSKGYNNLIDIDPFFNNSGLSGFNSKSAMQSRLDNIFAVSMSYDENGDGQEDGTYDISGPILSLLDYNNTAYYVNSSGMQDANGHHVLYWDLQARADEFTPEELTQRLNEQKWSLYMGYYTDAKRKTKLSLSEVSACPALREELEQIDHLPTEEEDIRQFGRDMGMYGPVSDIQVQIFINTLSMECASQFSTADSTSIADHLQTYFDRDLENMLEFIDINDLDTDPDLIAIESILQTYGCGLAGFAMENPLRCLRDTTITLMPIRASSPGVTSLQEVETFSGQEKQTLSMMGAEQPSMQLMGGEPLGRLEVEPDEDLYYGYGDAEMDSLMRAEMKRAEEEIIERIRSRREGVRDNEGNEGMQILTADGEINDIQLETADTKEMDTDDLEIVKEGRRDDIRPRELSREKMIEKLKRYEEITGEPILDFALGDVAHTRTVESQEKPQVQSLKAQSDDEPQVVSKSVPKPVSTKLDIKDMIKDYEPTEWEKKMVEQRKRRIDGLIEKAIENQNLESQSRGDGAMMMTMNSTMSSPIPPAHEITALINLYDSLGGDGWFNKSGWKDTNGDFDTLNIANWYGITLNAAGNVVAIELEGNHLDGYLPHSLGDFDQLLTLKIANNRVFQAHIIRGPIPEEIGNLSQLIDLKLVGDSISGQIPISITNLTNLVSLEIRSTVIGGEIPSNIGDLVNLEYLCISHVKMGTGYLVSNITPIDMGPPSNISGVIPASIGQLTKLKTLNLNKNLLTGSFPHEIGNLTQLESIEAYGNLLNGELPDNLANCTGLKSLYIANGGWSQVSSTAGVFNNHGGNNMTGKLHGRIPSSLWLLSADENSFEGLLPSNFAADSTHFNLSVSYNSLSGDIPTEYLSKSFQTFNIRGNNFASTIPFIADNLFNYHDLHPDSDPFFDQESCYWYFEDNALTFSNLLPTYLDIKNVIDFGEMLYAPQDSVDVPKEIIASLDSTIYFTTDIDRDISPKCKYQWFKDGAPLNELDTAGHTIAITLDSLNDFGNYYYKITNDSLPDLTLWSRMVNVVNENCPGVTPPEEIVALIQLYNVTSGDEWTNNTGWKDANGDFDTLNVDNWYGITLDECGNVIKVEFNNNNLNGDITQFDQVNQLTYLEVLRFFGNQLMTGDIQYINFNDNIYLKEIYLGYSSISGDIDKFNISNLSMLENLHLAQNNLTGNIGLFDVSNNVKMKHINIPFNDLQGNIHEWNMFDLVDLESINLWDNSNLTGNIELLDLTNNINLERLWLVNSKINGRIENFDITNNTDLDYLWIAGTEITGDITVWDLSKNNSLSWLELSLNSIGGEIHLANNFPSSLQFLGLGYNEIEGSVHEWSLSLPNLRILELFTNNIEGNINQWDPINKFSELATHFYIGSNRFTFAELLPYVSGNISLFPYYSPQDSIDTHQIIPANLNDIITLSTEIDRNSVYPSKYQWFKDGVAISPHDTASHTISINLDSLDDFGDYYYNITNDSLPDLTLWSQVRTVQQGISCPGVTPSDQIAALIQLYELTNRGDTTWTNNNWKIAGQFDTANVENWYGVHFNTDGAVFRIHLVNNNLIGDLSQWDKVSDLCQLQHLILQSDSLYGNLHEWDISGLANLETLNLYNNKLSGNLDQWVIGSLSKLTNLNLSYNNIYGNIMSVDLAPLSNLYEINLRRNQVSGNIGNWGLTSQSLRILDVSLNNLTGTIESLDLSGVPDLAFLALHSNQGIVGDISQFDVSVVPQLTSLNLNNCNIAGDVTIWDLSGLQYLDYLGLGSNDITGNITNLYLGHNLDLRTLYLYNNKLTGCLADWDISYLTNLETLYLYGNTFNCDLSNWDICDLTSLRQLNLRNTGLTGNIQDWNINCVTSLQSLDLGNNLLQGQINLWDINNLSALQNLYIDNNQIAGNIDGWNISDLANIRYLQASYNNIGGQINQWPVNSLTNLIYLNLMNNVIEGDIGQWNISNLTRLVTLQINNNEIAGDITPWRIGTLAALTNLQAQNNSIVGDITQCEIENLTGLVTLNFDNNYLHGDFTHWNIGNLTNLQVLGLDSSRLTGTIDSIDFGNLRALRNLHLTGSKIYGNLDSAGIANFNSLITLKLNGNNFSGNLNNWPRAVSMNTIQIDSNAFTFTGLLPFVLNANVPNLSYIPQDSIDVERNIYADGLSGTATLATEIDKYTSPRSKFQWYNNGVAISTLDTANHTFQIDVASGSVSGPYHYIVANESIPGLILYSRPVYVLPDTVNVPPGIRELDLCLEYDMDNPAFKASFGAEVNLEESVQQCIDNLQRKLDTVIFIVKEKLIEQKLSQIYRDYTTSCISRVTETLNYTYASKEYHYTLYYYDQAGNLVQTVPPKGVNPLTNSQTNSFVPGTSAEPAHELVTRYKYNSLNQLTWQNSPDGGTSRFWYDKKGQLRLSQNAEQSLHDKYSYTKYDALGRITEVGELADARPIANIIPYLDVAQYPMPGEYPLNDITNTFYDIPAQEELISSGFRQENLRSRVSYVQVRDTEASDPVTTYYSYDAHGNVTTLLQQIPGIGEKRTDYVYDLISGNVNMVMYQYGEPDQFFHRYSYDADNRLIRVETSHDGYIWSEDARYYYYAHGPLARVELGEHKVQGLDYYYTLQGWLKGVNNPITGDPGEDGTLTAMMGKDEFAFTLGYFNGDYAPIGADFTTTDYRDNLWTRYNEARNTQGLYNGNIAWMATQLPEAGRRNDDGEKQGYQAMLYHYDQLNRIKAAHSLTNFTAASGFGSRVGGHEAYDASYTYDPNGNLLTLQRRDEHATLSHDYIYEYFAGTNRLKKVTDEYTPEVPASKTYNENPLIPDGQQYRHIILEDGAAIPDGHMAEIEATETITINPGVVVESGGLFTAEIVPAATVTIPAEGQFLYDEIGNLVRDNGEGVTIAWTPYGKVRSVTKDNGDLMTFRYDATGNRVEKSVTTDGTTTTTHYIRDASGNVMATYTDSELKEQPIYGSSRVGMYLGGAEPGKEKLGFKRYELNNHLGNVLAVITDNINIDESQVTASAASVSDYYPFGLATPGRTFSAGEYRYGFNGKEKDQNGEWGDTHYNFGARIYNPAIGRWLSVDPYQTAYPFASPYNFALNTPIQAVDPDGNLVIFINGLRLWQGARDQYGPNFGGAQIGIQRQSFTSPEGLYNYWRTGTSDGQFERNAFGRTSDIAFGFMNRIDDYNSYFTSGSSYWNSQAIDREIEGARKAEQFHQMVQDGQIELADDETIKIVSHSQGGAHAHGFANRLLEYKDADGNQLYNIEVIYDINPHQSSDITPVPGVRTVTYQHWNDGVSGSNANFIGLPWLFPNGGSTVAPIPGAENIIRNIMGPGSDNPNVPAEGPNGNRSGHNVTDNDEFIFSIPANEEGGVRRRQDN